MWHAGSYDDYDLLGSSGLHPFFKGFEESCFNCLDRSFVATNYHKKLIGSKFKNIELDKIIVTGLPYNFDHLDKYKNLEKENIILFPHRLSEEKQPNILKDLEPELNKHGYECIFCQEETLSKHEYHTLLGKSKMIFSASLQETWGIGAFEGMYVNSLPFLPSRLSYTEMYKGDFLYPSAATFSYKDYLICKSELIASIIARLNIHKKYYGKMKENIKTLKEKYCTIENIKKEVLNA